MLHNIWLVAEEHSVEAGFAHCAKYEGGGVIMTPARAAGAVYAGALAGGAAGRARPEVKEMVGRLNTAGAELPAGADGADGATERPMIA